MRYRVTILEKRWYETRIEVAVPDDVDAPITAAETVALVIAQEGDHQWHWTGADDATPIRTIKLED